MSVNKFRKRPVEIEAMQYDGRNTVEVAEWLAESGVKVGWSNAEMVIPTLEGRMHATPGDWIIRGVQDEFYPCKPDIFEATYEAPRQADREPSDADFNRAAQTFYEASGLNLPHTSKPEVVAGVRAAWAALIAADWEGLNNDIRAALIAVAEEMPVFAPNGEGAPKANQVTPDDM